MMGSCIAQPAQSIGSSKPMPQEAEVSIEGLSGSRIPAVEEVWELQKCLHLMLCASVSSARHAALCSSGEDALYVFDREVQRKAPGVMSLLQGATPGLRRLT